MPGLWRDHAGAMAGPCQGYGGTMSGLWRDHAGAMYDRTVAELEQNFSLFFFSCHITSGSVENNLEFCGLIVMKNALRPESAPVIATLNEANIRTVMVTGEGLNYVSSFGRACVWEVDCLPCGWD